MMQTTYYSAKKVQNTYEKMPAPIETSGSRFSCNADPSETFGNCPARMGTKNPLQIL